MAKKSKYRGELTQEQFDELEFSVDALDEVISILQNMTKLFHGGIVEEEKEEEFDAFFRLKNFTLTAEDWGLFSIANADQVARELNADLKWAVTHVRTPLAARDYMFTQMNRYIKWGAEDTEPQVNVCWFINQLYPGSEDIDRWD